jgi:transcriptional regulator with XRE-family HTH domain
MTHESLARKLRILRAARGITLAEAEELTGVTRETLGALEHGQRGAYTSTLEKIARGYGVTVSALLSEVEEPEAELALAGSSPGKVEAPREAGSSQKSEEERRAGYLRAWRAFVYKLVQRWEQDPPKSSREIAVVLDTIQDLLKEGAFERPPEQVTTSDEREASEWLDLSLLFRGIDRLNQIEIVDTVEEMTDTTQEMAEAARADAEAERLRATFREIKGQLAG